MHICRQEPGVDATDIVSCGRESSVMDLVIPATPSSTLPGSSLSGIRCIVKIELVI